MTRRMGEGEGGERGRLEKGREREVEERENDKVV